MAVNDERCIVETFSSCPSERWFRYSVKEKDLKQLYVWNKGVYLSICFDQRVVRSEESDLIFWVRTVGFETVESLRSEKMKE